MSKEREFVIVGGIQLPSRYPAAGAGVAAFDRDMRTEQLLGRAITSEDGSYEITYTTAQFSRAEKGSADVIIRAEFEEEGRKLRAASDIHFNVGPTVRIDLTLAPVPEPPRRDLSELETLRDEIEPLREGVEYPHFTDDDLHFLSHELARRNGDCLAARFERRVIRQLLGFLRQAARSELETGTPLMAFYGWFRLGLSEELDALLDTPLSRLQEALEEARARRIIPDEPMEPIADIVEGLQALRFERGRRVRRRFVGRLIADESGEPLADHWVAAFDLTAEPEEQALGTVTTDGHGIFMIYLNISADIPEDAARRLRIVISDGEREIGATEIMAPLVQREIVDVRIEVSPDPIETVAIGSIASPGLAERLRARGIHTLRDVLNHPDIDDSDTGGMERLRAHARFAGLAPDLDEAGREALLAARLDGPLAPAAISRGAFVAAHHERLGGDAAAYATHFGAQEAEKVLYHMIGGAWLKTDTGPDSEPDEIPDIPPVVSDTLNRLRRCGCKDCSSAVSPAAYLAHLLKWILKHLKDVGDPISFSALERDLFQPFGDLPASCEAVEEQVRQVRICAEILWRSNGWLESPDLNLPFPVRHRYRQVRNDLYRRILTNLGVAFDELRQAVLVIEDEHPAAEIIAARRRSVAERLGIAEARLIEPFPDGLFFNIDMPPAFPNEAPPISPTEAQLQELFGYRSTRLVDVFERSSRPLLNRWQRERLETVWQTLDWSLDQYHGPDRRPFVDPEIITEAYLRAGDNPAAMLLASRGDALAAHRQALIAAAPFDGLAAFVAFLEGELGQTMDQWSAIHDTLQAGGQSDLTAEQFEDARDAVAALNLTLAGFTHLLNIHARLKNDEPLGATNEEVETAQEAVFDILTRAHRHASFAQWVADEQAISLVFGPKLFWLPLEEAPAPNPWQAGSDERLAWETALRRRSGSPVIDPDQISMRYVSALKLLKRQMRATGLPLQALLVLPPAVRLLLWDNRRRWIKERLDAVRAARAGQATSLEALEAMLAASTLGVGLDVFDELADRERSGAVLPRRLEQLNLSLPAYRVLAKAHLLAVANATVGVDLWDQVEGILVRAEKEREFAEWRGAEQQLGVYLHPHHFDIPDPIPPVDDSLQARWRHDALALEQWKATLEARNAQLEALEEALFRAVGDAEEAVLPNLRNLLIAHSPLAPDGTANEKADWLDGRLLVDMRMAGCQMTTRVSQAIETLQRLVRGVYAQEHRLPLTQYTLDTEEDYEAEWSVIGSYGAWRAFMLAYLFPENLLHLSPPRLQSYGLTRLKQRLSSQVGPAEACAAANEYADYFKDVSHLEVQASCQVQTRVVRKTGTGCDGVATVLRSRVHLFALATTSGKVYSNSFAAHFETKDTLGSWLPVNGLTNVLEVIGAVPHETPKQQRLILLFAKVREDSKNRLMMLSFDLDDPTSGWSKAAIELRLPPGAESDFSAVAVQKRHGGLGVSGGITGGLAVVGGGSAVPTTTGAKLPPTLLAIRVKDGRIYVRDVNASATNWAGDSWIPLVGPIIAKAKAQLCALIQRGTHEYVFIVRNAAGMLQYRHFSPRPPAGKDDGFWRSIAQGTFQGAFNWPGSPDVYVIFEANGLTRYALIKTPGSINPQGFPAQSIGQINNWLKAVAGVDLRHYRLDFTTSVVLEEWPKDHNPLNGVMSFSDITIDIHYSGNLYDLVSLTTQTWTWSLPALVSTEEFSLIKSKEQYRQFALSTIKGKGLEIFGVAVAGAGSAELDDPDIGWWRLADQYVRAFANGMSLANLIFNGSQLPFRGLQTESTTIGTWNSAEAWFFVPSGGDEEVPQAAHSPRKAIALRNPDGAFRLKLQRVGDALSLPALWRIAPSGDGPFNLSPLSSKSDLSKRASEIKGFYDNLGNSPGSVKAYLKEAYNLVPLHLGYQLQRQGFHEQALIWYRQVLDYLQPEAAQKIDYSLKLEESLALSHGQAEDWLDDTSNAHAIAATRRNSYTRHALLLIIRCLIDQADALFTNDNVTDNFRARELYSLALKLLESEVLRPGKSRCADILGQLEIEVVEPFQIPMQAFKMILAEIEDPNQLDRVVKSLNAINQDTDPDRDLEMRLGNLQEVVRAALGEVRPPLGMSAILQNDRATVRTLQEQFLAQSPTRTVLKTTRQSGRESALVRLAEVTGRSLPELVSDAPPALPWLRGSRLEQREPEDVRFDPSAFDRSVLARVANIRRMTAARPMTSLSTMVTANLAINTGLSFEFCIPQNPVVQALRRRAENNLTKLRTCRNIAGFVRQMDPYGAPIGIGSGLVSADGKIFNGIVEAPPTPYRYSGLVGRAKELVTLAQQIETGYQTALERAEGEAMSVLQAEQGVELANARVVAQDLRVNQANIELGLTQLQQNSAVLRERTYAGWIAGGMNQHEQDLLEAYRDAGEAQKAANDARSTAQKLEFAAAAIESVTNSGNFKTIPAAAAAALRTRQSFLAMEEGRATGRALEAQTRAQVASTQASFERRSEEWQLQRGLAAVDMQIGEQQIMLASGGIEIARQERAIAGLEQTHAADVLRFQLNKDFNEEMYRWIASILEDVYRFFLQTATSMARLAERQLAFERQQGPLKLIQSNYWQLPAPAVGSGGNGTDRMGLTGSARLLKDLYELDNLAFNTRRSQQRLTLTLDLAEMFPVEFQRFRKTGILVFETSQGLIDRQMPGYYLCLIKEVIVSVVALVPPTRGIRATLTSAGPSRVVVRGDTFQTVLIRNLPERIALTAPMTSSAGILELEPDAHSLQRPFEGIGCDTRWELRMPHSANPFDYNTVATVLFTLDLTALHSHDYEREVIERLDRRVSANRAFSFRQEFADQWYDLNNPDLTDAPMTVVFRTRREDFPPNVEQLRIEQVMLYFVGAGGEHEEIAVTNFAFEEAGSTGMLGGGATTVDGAISTRRGNGTSWLPMIGMTPTGEWTLSLDDTLEIRNRFKDEQIKDILLIVVYGGVTPNWPV